MEFHTIIEPFRIKTVEIVHRTTQAEREVALRKAGYNLFLLKAEDVLIDLLTDSGTGAMSSRQWAEMMQGDESYAGGRSFYRFEKVVKKITKFKHVIPTHQGRAAERLLFGATLKPGDMVANNTHLDITRANIEYYKASPVDLSCPESREYHQFHPFKGNINLAALETHLEQNLAHTPMVVMLVTNDAGGGQPVSMANLRGASEICRRYGVPLFLDASRFAENAWFIKIRERGYADKSPKEIAQEMFSYVDGCTMSAKKDGLTNIGGFLALNDDKLAERCKHMLISSEGFSTYGGLAGYDLEAIAVGLREVLNEDYLRYRIRSVQYLGAGLAQAGLPIVRPVGGHAVYIDAGKMLSHIPTHEYPAWSLTLALYLVSGIRCAEVGSVMLGQSSDQVEKTNRPELVRLAFPRRVYSQSHLDYISEALLNLYKVKDYLRGVQLIESPDILRHFTARFKPTHGKLLILD